MSFHLRYHETVINLSLALPSSVTGTRTCRERRDAPKHWQESAHTGCGAKACRQCRPENPRISWQIFWRPGKSRPVPHATPRRWSSGYSPREVNTDDGRMSHCHRLSTWFGSDLGGASDVDGVTMNMHPIRESSDQLITALRQMTVEQLLQLGTRRVVYLKAGTHDGELDPFALYGADGAFLTAFDTFEEAVEMVAANDLNFVAIH